MANLHEQARPSFQQRKRIFRRMMQWQHGLTRFLVAALAVSLLIDVVQTALPLALATIIKVLPGNITSSLFFQLIGVAVIELAANWLGMGSIALRGTGIERQLQRMRATYHEKCLQAGTFGRKPPASDMTNTLEKSIPVKVYWIIAQTITFLVTSGGTLLLSANPWTLIADILLGVLILLRSLQRGKKMGRLAQYSRAHRSAMGWIMERMHTGVMRTQIDMHPAIQHAWLAAFEAENRERFSIDRRSMNWNGFYINLAGTIGDLGYHLEFLIPVGLAYFQHTRELLAPVALYTLAKYASAKLTAISSIGSYFVDLGEVVGEQKDIVEFVVAAEEAEEQEKASRSATPKIAPQAHDITLENFSISIQPSNKEEKKKILVPTWDEWTEKKKKRTKTAPLSPPPPRYLLRNVNLHIGTLGSRHGAGEICGIVAENGAGKTTLLNVLMAGLNTGNSSIKVTGRAMIGGVDIKRIDKERYVRDCVAYCQQRFERSLGSIRENIVAGHDIDPGIVEHVAKLLRITNLEDVFEVGQEDTLSGGEKRKVAIAQVAVRTGKVLVAAFDEPSNDLDGLAIEGLIELLQAMRNAGMLVLVISHDERITSLFDSAVYMPGDGSARYDTVTHLARDPEFAKLAKMS